MSTEHAAPVVIWGEVLWDRFPDGDRLGGAPANVAWHLGMAGGHARLVSRVGDDADGRRAIAQLAEHCDTSLVQIDRERATGEVEVVVESGEPSYRLVAGRAWEHIACTDDVRAALADASVFVYGTLAQRTVEGLDAWTAAVDAARASCINVCDLNLRKNVQPRAAIEIERALDAADVVKVNDRELDVLASWYAWRDPIDALRAGRRIVAITHGAAGSTLYGDSTTIEIAGERAPRAADNVGCGDAYLGILVHGMTLGWDLAASGRAASRWAAAVAGERGATPRFSTDQIDELLGAGAA
jgi:fructokinase